MLKFGHAYVQKIEKQKKILESHCQRIEEIQDSIESYRKGKQLNPKSNADSSSIPQKIQALEYRLSNQLQKFNQAIAQNKLMREKFESMRKERVVFDMIYRQLEADIKSKREELITVMGKTDKAENMRDESRAELERLKAEASKLKEMFQSEWNEVVDKSLKEQNETINMNQIKDSNGNRGKFTSSDQEKNAEETENNFANRLRQTIARAAWAVAKDGGSIHVHLKHMHQYEEALATVKEAIGMNGSI